MNIQKAIEHGQVEIVDFPIKNGGSFHGKMLVHQRVQKLDGALQKLTHCVDWYRMFFRRSDQMFVTADCRLIATNRIAVLFHGMYAVAEKALEIRNWTH